MNCGYLIKRFALPAGEWTPIKAPWVCNYFSLKSQSGNALLIATSETDEAQIDMLAANAQESVTVPREGGARWQTGDTMLYAQPAGVSDEVAVVKFLS